MATQESPQMPNGTVKFFNTQKGFGFIAPDTGGGKDAFVHVTTLERAGISSLNEGDKVSFDLETGRDGKASATNIKLLR
jgi:CspA family cold shock protein